RSLSLALRVQRLPADCCDAFLCLSNLLRFFRLQRHRNWHGADHGLRPDGEFPPALFRPLNPRVLGTLAHLPVYVVPGLSLYSAWWQPRALSAPPAQPFYRLSGQRAVARRKLDVRDLGSAAWFVRGRRSHLGTNQTAFPFIRRGAPVPF